MSIKKTSILALSVLLSYESFAAPTVLATTPRLGASSSVASTGRGKATTSVSIGGGLNKLTSNRGQGSFTPNSAPTDKQNELIENFQKEIQNVRDAVAEELQDQNDMIEELKEKIKEKDEKIAELEESIDEKIESKGFVTAESVRSEISTAKQEAVRQATKAAVADVNSMGFAKTAEIESKISTAKNAAIELAKNAALAEVESKGFATTTSVQNLRTEIANERATTTAQIDAVKNEIQADVEQLNNNINNINIDGAIENKLASKNYATTAQLTENINAAKNEIQADVDQLNNSINNINIDGAIEDKLASKGYATTTQLAADINAAKAEITTARNTALESYATSADVSSAVATLATKKELQELEVGVDQDQLTDIINEKLQEGNFATATALSELSEKVTQNTQNITEESGKIEELDARLAPGFVTPAELSEVAGTIATLEKDLDDVNGTLADFGNNIAHELVNNKDFTDSVLSGLGDTVDGLARRVTAAEGTINSLDTTYATKGEIEPDVLTGKLSGKFVAKEGLSSTIAELEDENGKIFVTRDRLGTGVATLFGEKDASGLTTLTTSISDLKQNAVTTENFADKLGKDDAIAVLQSKGVVTDGNFTDKLTKNTQFIAELEDENGKIFVTRDRLGTGVATLFGEKDASGLTTLTTSISDLKQNAVTTENFADKLGKDDAIAVLQSKGVVTDGNFTNKLTANPKFKELDTRFVPSKDVKDEEGNYTFVTQTDVKEIPSAVIAEMQNSKSKNYIGNWTDSTGEKKLLVTQAELGTGVAKLFGETDETGLTKFKSTVTNLNDKAVTTDTFGSQLTANDTFKAAQAKVTSVEADLANKADSADVVTKTSLSEDLGTLANNKQLPSSIVTTGNLADNGIVTQSSLTKDLYDGLTAGTGNCPIEQTDTDKLKSLLNETFTTCEY